MKTNGLKWFFVGAITVTVSFSVLAAVNIPNSFTAGQPIKAADVNANFSSLKAAVEALQTNPVTAPLNLERAGANVVTLTGGGSGVGGPAAVGSSSLIVSNTNPTAGIGAYISSLGQDASLVVAKGSSGGQLLKGLGTGGVEAFKVNEDGSAMFNGALTVNSSTENAIHGISTNNYGGYFESLNGPGLRIKSGGTGNILTSFGADNAIKFQVDKDGVGTFAGNVTARGILLTSDRNAKQNFSSVNSLSILEKVARLPIQSWTYKTDADGLRHIGPMAQDFHAAFNLNGSDDRHISVVDGAGVALAAIQGLNQKLETENAALKTQLAALEMRLTALERK